MVTVIHLDYAFVLFFIFNSAIGEQSCDIATVNDPLCPPTLTCVPKNNSIGYCECLPGLTKINETFCKKLEDNVTPKSSSLVEEENNGSGHVVAGILIPMFLIMVVIGGIYFNRKYHLVDYITTKLYQRNSNYDEVMIGQDLDDDDPPLR